MASTASRAKQKAKSRQVTPTAVGAVAVAVVVAATQTAIITALRALGLTTGNRGSGSTAYTTIGTGLTAKGKIANPMFFVGAFGKGCNVAFVSNGNGNLPNSTTNQKYYSLPGFCRNTLPNGGLGVCITLQVVQGNVAALPYALTLPQLLAVVQNIAARQIPNSTAAKFKAAVAVPAKFMQAPTAPTA